MKKNLLYILMLVCVAIFTACNENDLVDQDYDSAHDKVHFYGAVKKQSSIQVTSRVTPNPDLYITLNETTEDFGIFYIWQKVVDNNETEQIFQQYKETNGTQGNLEINDNGTPLNWHNKTSKHTFYAWTQPSVKTGDDDEITGGVKMDETFQYGEQLGGIEPSGTVIYGTNEDTELEKFIIAQKGPISYDEWGQDVALYFERPIAKITLKGVTYITASGAENPNIETCTILFPNMFKTAMFKPLNWTNGVQNVLQTVDEAVNKGITWEWYKENESNEHDAHSLYVHPFKFGNEDEAVSAGNNVSIHDNPGFFIVKLEVTKNNVKSYTGTLNSLSTIRELKAGEHMQLYLTVTDGGGVGVGYEIVDWTDKGSQTLPQYRIPGVYNEEDAERLLEALTSTDPNALDEIKDLLVLTSDEGVAPETYVINLFTHVNWSGQNITIPTDYTLKGNGYNVTLGDGERLGGNYENIYINNVYNAQSDNTGTDDTGSGTDADAGA